MTSREEVQRLIDLAYDAGSFGSIYGAQFSQYTRDVEAGADEMSDSAMTAHASMNASLKRAAQAHQELEALGWKITDKEAS